VKKKLKSEDAKHSFHTAYLSLLSSDLYWAKTEDVIEIKAQLSFNYIVKPEEVAKNLELFIDGKKTNFLLKSGLNSEVIEVSIPEAGNNYEQKPVKVVVKAGLGCLNSSYKTKEDIIIESNVPSKGAFSVTEITAEVINESNIFNVHTNQSIDKSQNMSSLIRVLDQDSKAVEGITFELYDFGVFVKGDFKESENYEIQISKDMKGIFGGKLGKDVNMFVSFVQQSPKLSFAAKSSIYLTSKGERNLGIKAVNVKDIEVQIYKIFENNVIHFLNNASAIESYNYYEYDGEEGGYYDEYSRSNYFNGNYEDFGKLVSSSVISTASMPKNGKQYLLNLNLNDVEDTKGIYAVKIVSKDSYYLNDTKILAFSDLGLIVKEDKEDVYVFVNSIQSSESESGVKVELVTRNNQTVAKEESNSEGVVVFKGIKPKLESELKMVFARKGNDFTYLHLNQTRVDMSKFDMGGEAESLSGYQLFVYGDRDLYRPGEKVNVNTVLRDDAYNTVENFPLELILRTPNGNEFAKVKGTVNAAGAFAATFNIPVAAMTGTYTIEVYSANKVLLNAKNISIEEFMPDRISVKADLDKQEVAPGQRITLTATASNLFGTPAASRNYEVNYSIAKKYLYFKNYPNYNFGVSGDLSRDIKSELREGKTSSSGTFAEVFEISKELKNSGIYTAKTFTTVFDENGRPVNR
ncbi:MAG TPA: MG2 domain-containing protein, partial [Cytophagales bacterium]|nr:MG2 domain-containing protein [Cytophagales bacterium]